MRLTGLAQSTASTFGRMSSCPSMPICCSGQLNSPTTSATFSTRLSNPYLSEHCYMCGETLQPFCYGWQPNEVIHYRLWQRGGGYDRNVVEPATVYHQIDYIHNNPVRRGLCENSEDWPWSSAAQYAGLRSGPLTLDRESLPLFVGP